MQLIYFLYSLLFPSFVSSMTFKYNYDYEFSKFVTKYNKQYQSEDEYNLRFSIFTHNFNKIKLHNENNEWKMDINHYADLTSDEFKNLSKKSNCVNLDSQLIMPRQKFEFVNIEQNLPDSWDWTEKGAVTPVKDQDQCGSCWAFSTTGSVEGSYFLSSGKLVSLSEQQLVDCSSSYNNQGCSGGLMDNAFNYIIQNGICKESDYPYKAVDGTCKHCDNVLKITSFVDVTPNNEEALRQAVYKQPVSVAIEADQNVFQFYSGGVMSSPCGTNLDHGVLVVGWGELDNKPYWKVKNSWGEFWGDNGYILLERNVNSKEGQCGIAVMPSYPVISNQNVI